MNVWDKVSEMKARLLLGRYVIAREGSGTVYAGGSANCWSYATIACVVLSNNVSFTRKEIEIFRLLMNFASLMSIEVR